MAVDSESFTRRTEPPGDCIFRESSTLDESAIREIFRQGSVPFRAAEKPAGAKPTTIGLAVVHVCERDGEVVAVIQWRNLGEEAEILDIAVAEAHRHQGNARFLLEKFLCLVQERGVQDVFLEVRESNAAAIALYRQFGFSASGRRPKYYQHPLEDALLLHLKISH